MPQRLISCGNLHDPSLPITTRSCATSTAGNCSDSSNTALCPAPPTAPSTSCLGCGSTTSARSSPFLCWLFPPSCVIARCASLLSPALFSCSVLQCRHGPCHIMPPPPPASSTSCFSSACAISACGAGEDSRLESPWSEPFP